MVERPVTYEYIILIARSRPKKKGYNSSLGLRGFTADFLQFHKYFKKPKKPAEHNFTEKFPPTLCFAGISGLINNVLCFQSSRFSTILTVLQQTAKLYIFLFHIKMYFANIYQIKHNICNNTVNILYIFSICIHLYITLTIKKKKKHFSIVYIQLVFEHNFL